MKLRIENPPDFARDWAVKKNPQTYQWEPSDEDELEFNKPIGALEHGFWIGISAGASVGVVVGAVLTLLVQRLF